MGRVLRIIVVSAIACGAGCRGEADTTSDRPIAQARIEGTDEPSESKPIATEANELERYVVAVQRAQTPQAEADALRQLMRHGADNGLTYTARANRTYDNLLVEDPSVRPDPVRVEVTIFRGQSPVRTFHFNPRNNRNLALLGE